MDQPTPEEILEQQQTSELIFKGLSALSEKQRHRIYEHFFLGMSKADIARKEGCSENSVKDSIRRGLGVWKNILKKNYKRPRRFTRKMYYLIEGTYSVGQA